MMVMRIFVGADVTVGRTAMSMERNLDGCIVSGGMMCGICYGEIRLGLD